MRIFAPFLQSLLKYASYQNLDTNVLKALISNRELDLCNENETVSIQDYLSVFNYIASHSKGEQYGLGIGAFLNLNSLGLVLEISLNTSSILQAVVILQNFLANKFPIVSANIVTDEKLYIVQLTSPAENELTRKHLLDMVTCVVYRELKLMLPPNYHPHVRLPYIDREGYSSSFGEISYSSHFQIVLPLSIVQTEINQKRLREIELILPKFISMLNEEENHSKVFATQVRKMILHLCSPELPNFEQVQQQFHYSNRTMQRKLNNEGTSFRKIMNGIKQELSSYLSSEKHLKTKDIAYILGYSEPSAYLHAVQSWKKN